jgi:hypothetical protein
LADQVARTGQGKVLTRNGESYVAHRHRRRLRRADGVSARAALERAARRGRRGWKTSTPAENLSWDEFRPRLHALRQRVRQRHSGSRLGGARIARPVPSETGA